MSPNSALVADVCAAALGMARHNANYRRRSMRAAALILAVTIGDVAIAQEPDRNSWNSPLDPLVVTTERIANGKSQVLLVIHEEGHGGWQLYDGSDVSNQKPYVLPKTEALKLDPTLREITDLAIGWRAERTRKGAKWIRKRL